MLRKCTWCMLESGITDECESCATGYVCVLGLKPLRVPETALHKRRKPTYLVHVCASSQSALI